MRLRAGRHRRPRHSWRRRSTPTRSTTIVNFAAESHNSLAILDPARFFRTNVLGTQTLCEAARRHGVARFHHISTCEVYGDLPSTPTRPSPRRPRTGRAPPTTPRRRGRTTSVRSYVETFGLPATITNCCNNYGPYQFPEKVIPLFTASALDDEPLPLYASTQNRREWLHVDDHCRAVELVLEHGEVGETYNVGSGIEASIEEIADAVLARHRASPPRSRRSSPTAPATTAATCSTRRRSARELGWEPTVPLHRGARRPRSPGTAPTGRWWEPLRDRAPVVEGDWSPPGGSTARRPSRDRPRGCSSPAATASSAETFATSWPAGSRTGEALRPAWRRQPSSPRCGTGPSTCCRPTSTRSTWPTGRRRAPRGQLRPDVVLHGGA